MWSDQISNLYTTRSTWPFIKVRCVNDAKMQLIRRDECESKYMNKPFIVHPAVIRFASSRSKMLPAQVRDRAEFVT